MFKTKYRIVYRDFYYDIEEWNWFFPFWVSTPATEFCFADLEDAERVVNSWLDPNRCTKRVVKEFF